MHEITFAAIDHLFAKHLVKNKDHPLYHFCLELMKSSREGNLFFTQKKVHLSITELLNKGNAPIVKDGDDYYLSRNFYHEQEIAEKLSKRISLPRLKTNIPTPSHLNAKQQKAFTLLNTSPFFLLTGGPGSGKSFVAKEIIKAYQETFPNKKIICTAPTGKALSALSKTNTRAQTLHKLLGIREGFDKKEHQTFIIADLLIVDECSMISPKLFNLLLSSLLDITQVILIGDPHQLPPVSGASIFYDFTNIRTIDQIKLTAPMRSDKRAIIDFSDAILKEEESKILKILKEENEITLKPLEEFKPGAHLNDHILLTPFRKGPFGSLNLNEQIRPLKESSVPILITKNDPITGLTNGDIGFIQNEVATFSEKGITLPKLMLPPYEKAFALSIHKSQGSEFNHVTIILPEESDTFPKELLFTAITRAKKSITIYGSIETLITLIKNSTKAASNLQKKIKQAREI